MLITVLTALFSGVMGALLSTYFYIRREKRKEKVDTLKRFAANRYDLQGDEFTRALNEIFVVFNDAPAVMQALEEFHKTIISNKEPMVTDDTLVKLYKAMCKNTKIDFNRFNDSFFLTPFNTRTSSTVGTD